jgi:hypothetical protein
VTGDTATEATGVDGETTRPALAPVPWTAVLVVVGVLVAVLLALAARYGYHRDELYFRLLSQRLEIGYTDQPVGTPAVVRLMRVFVGDTIWSVRVPAALFAGLTVVLTALLARELGGGRTAQVLTAVGTAASGFVSVTGHVLLTSSLDLPVWAAAILCLVRALRSGDSRWWAVAGAVCGVGLLNKQMVVLLILGLAVGLLAVGPRRVLLDRYLLLGVLAMLVIGAPSIVYQFTHGFPQLDMASALSDDKGFDDRTQFVPLQLLLLGPLVAPVWIAGLVALFRRPEWRMLRCFGVAYVVACVITLIGGGRSDYVVSFLIMFLAMGFVTVEGWLARARGAARRWLLGVALVLNALSSVWLALPVLPVAIEAHTGAPGINPTIRDEVGWPRYAAQVAAVYRSVPAADRAATALIAGNYGEAGALDRYRAANGLPKVYSGHNELYHRGAPPADATMALLVGVGEPAELSAGFRDCTVAARLDNGTGMDNEEQGTPVVICRGLLAPWPTLWPKLHHLS